MRKDVINKLIQENGYKSYLEIGLADGKNFRDIVIDYKVGVDPVAVNNIFAKQMESDSFFEQNTDTFDIIFIDGLHHSDQVERDIVNSYKVLNKGGVILIHDCLPPNKPCTLIPRVQREWCGDVFRSVEGFKRKYSDKIKTEYFDDPYGLFAIWKTGRYKVELGFNWDDLSYDEFSLM